MKLVVFVFILVTLSTSSYSQSWKDSLRSARAYYQEGDFTRAYNKFIAAQRLAPAEIDLSKDIATSAYRKGDYNKATDAFKKITQNPNVQDQWQKWHNIGNSQWKQQDLEAAAESFKQAIRLNPNADESKYNLAQITRQMRTQQEQEQQNNSDNDSSENDSSETANNREESEENNSPDNHEHGNSDAHKEKNHQDITESISDKRRDRMLEDLMEKEIATQRKMTSRDQDGKEVPVSSGKKW